MKYLQSTIEARLEKRNRTGVILSYHINYYKLSSWKLQ